MNNISKNRFLTGVVILLLIANITSLGLFWWTKEKQAPPPNAAGSAAATFLVTELNFDAQQQAAYKILREDHQQQTKILRENIRAYKKTFFDLLNQSVVDSVELKKQAELIGKTEAALNLFTFQHFRKVKLLCNAEQKQKFDSIIQQVLRMMGGQPTAPPPPRRLESDNPPLQDGPPPPDQMRDGMPPPGPPPPKEPK